MGFNYSTKFYCPGFVDFGNRKFHCWKKEGHGSLNLIDAVKKSCDCYFYNLAKEINIDELSKFSKKFSMGAITGIDIPDENYGLMPNSEWKKKNRGEKWQKRGYLKHCYWSGFYFIYSFANYLMTARIASGKN